ncbi:hypothetical protein MSSIH_0900 [Methanosarcina siciliae HI350]|uniref:Uncharacterized protein n=1 Tax=Methanosarcina siciliae HI350 TaxID=1434119 RepID=A0A0E3PD31_9EURY|nr:hypothetical protein MSSIH_0900 [Methanosarcina siciliae HI350]
METLNLLLPRPFECGKDFCLAGNVITVPVCNSNNHNSEPVEDISRYGCGVVSPLFFQLIFNLTPSH